MENRLTTARRRSLPITKAAYILVLIGLLGISGYFYKQNKDLKNNPTQVQQQEVAQLTEKVNKLYNLPEETPTIATVEDKDKLKDQPFFKDAQNNDKLLMFTNAKQAIIYRETDNKIINSGPIVISDTSSAENTPKN